MPLELNHTTDVPRISIVMPSYNQASYLDAAIRSVLDQGYPNLELIVMDGGSTDGSVAIIRRHADRIAYWQSRPDGGQARAVQAGFDRATGEVLGWLNSDDLLQPGALWRVAEAARNRCNESLMIVGDGLFVDADDRPVSRLTTGNWGQEDLLQVYAGKQLSQPAVFYTHPALQAAGPLDGSLQCVMDLDMWIRMRGCAELVVVPEVLARMRIHPDTKNNTLLVMLLDEERQVVRRYDHLLAPVRRLWGRLRMRHFAGVRLSQQAESVVFTGGDTRRAAHLLWEGVKQSPTALASGHAIRTLARLALPDWVRRAIRPGRRPARRHAEQRVAPSSAAWGWLGASINPGTPPSLRLEGATQTGDSQSDGVPGDVKQRQETISCIVPTYNRGEVLRGTLESLLGQSVLPREILVVDQSDRSWVDGRHVVASLGRPDVIRYVRQDTPNAQQARNRGAALAKGELLLFLDDDIEAAPGLVEAYGRLFADPRVGAATGMILCPGEAPTLRFPSEFHWARTGWMRFPLNYAQPTPTHNFSSCNTCVRRQVHWASGGFDENFVRTIFDDSDWSVRLCRELDRLGLLGLHWPDAEVLHWRTPAGGRRPGALNRFVAADAQTWETYFYFWQSHYGWGALRDVLHRIEMELFRKGLHRRPHWWVVAASCMAWGFWRALGKVKQGPRLPLRDRRAA